MVTDGASIKIDDVACPAGDTKLIELWILFFHLGSNQ